MSPLPDPASLVHASGLSPRSLLQRVLVGELARLKELSVPLPTSSRLDGPGAFESALRRDAEANGGAVIAEYKQASPSLGPFAMGTPLLPQLQAYKEGGASAFSILAEPAHFRGAATHIRAAAELGMPRLYKGFVISEAQLAEAEAAGAEAVLLIARVLAICDLVHEPVLALMAELRRRDAALAAAGKRDPAGVALLDRYASALAELTAPAEDATDA